MITAAKDLDARDTAIRDAWQKARDKITYPEVGDVVIFSDGVQQRISYVWPNSYQTSTGGSFYMLASGLMSFSGGLNPGVPRGSLRPAGRGARPGWFFHHGIRQAHNGVDVWVTVRVWLASVPADKEGR